MSLPDRAPRGIPIGGRFVPSSRAESAKTPLSGRPAPDSASAAYLRSLIVRRDGTIADRHTGEPVPDGTLTDEDVARVEDPYENEPETGQPLLDRVGETVDAIAELAGHRRDVNAGKAPAPDTAGTFVGWGQMLPSWVRRKDKSGPRAEHLSPEQAAAAEAERLKEAKFQENLRRSQRLLNASRMRRRSW